MGMIVTYLRSSSYGAHEMCPMSYFIEYNLGWRGPSGKKAEKGTIVHKVLEIIGNIKLTTQNGKKQFTDDIVGRVRVNSYDLDKITRKVYDHYVKYSVHEWEPKDFRECNRWVEKALTYNDGAFDPRNNNIEAVEKRFDIEITEPWAVYDYKREDQEPLKGFLALKGTIDQIVRVNDKTLEIVDWKTGARKNWATGEEKTWEKLRQDPQLRMYHYCVKRLYPDVDNVLVTIYFINAGGPFTIPFTDEDIPDTLNMIRAKFDDIRNTQRPQLKRSWKCTKFCHYGMSTFEGTSVLPIVEKRHGQVCSKGSCMTKCEQVRYCLEHRGMDSVRKHMTAPGHKVDYYQAPGEVSDDSGKS